MGVFAHSIRRAVTPLRGGILLAAGLVAVVGVSGVTGAASKKAVVVTDANDAASGTVDLTRVSVGAASKSRIKVNIRAAQDWDGEDLVASSGPPGSVCLKIWAKSEPPDQTPDYLLCVTATRDEQLRASLLRVTANSLPRRIARAQIDQSDRSVTLTFRQKSIGNPSSIRFVGESTRPGCIKVTCVDLAPNAPNTGRLKLSSGASTGT